MSSLGARVNPLLSSDTVRAAGMGLAVVGVNVVTLLFTILFARLLGTGEYGELAALTAALLTLLIPASALQITVARRISSEGVAGQAAFVRRMTHHVALASLAISIAALALREPTAQLINVEAEWAAGAIVPSACLGLLVYMQRGALQGVGRYRFLGGSLIGEALGRLVFGFALYEAGLGVTGVFLGTAVSLLVTAVVLDTVLDRADRPADDGASTFGDLVLEIWAPLLSLSLIALMQNIDLIVVKHNASGKAAGIYAAASLTAKVIVWIAVGLGYYLLPEAARRWSAGQDTRLFVVRILALLAVVSAPVIALYAVAGEQLLTAVFGPSYASGSGFLAWLALAMSVLALTYLAVQHLLARGRTGFILLLAIAAAVEPFLLSSFGADLRAVAIGLLALQVPLAAFVIAMDYRTSYPGPVPGQVRGGAEVASSR